MAKIKDVVYKRGIRTTEFFRDFDKRRSGVITANQVGGLVGEGGEEPEGQGEGEG